MRHVWLIVPLLFFVAGCGASKVSAPSIDRAFKPSGIVVVSRPAPAPKVGTNIPLLAFLPVNQGHEGKWLSIDRKLSKLTLMEGAAALFTIDGEGLENLKAGIYSVIHKQKSPLWYAPDTYFTARMEPVPAEGDKDRYRRGALGEFAMFLDKDTPLHCGPVSLPEIGGARLSDVPFSRVYYSLPVGAPVEVR